MNEMKQTGLNVPIITKHHDVDNTDVFDPELVPSMQMQNDCIKKKSAIYHPPVGKSSQNMTRKHFEEKCGDIIKIKLAYPMTYAEFELIPDSVRIEWIQSMFNKYPKISAITFSRMMGACRNIVTREFKRLGFTFDNSSTRFKSVELNDLIGKMNNGEIPANLTITRKNPIKDNLPRLSFKRVKKMPHSKAKEYFEQIELKYSNAITRPDFAALLGCGISSIDKLFAKSGFKYNNADFHKTIIGKKLRNQFYEDFGLDIEDSIATFGKASKAKIDESSEPAPVATDVEEANPISEEVPEPVTEVETKEEEPKEETTETVEDPVSVIFKEDPNTNVVKAKEEQEDKQPTGTFSIDKIEVTVDADYIGSLVKELGITGVVKVKIERIGNNV